MFYLPFSPDHEKVIRKIQLAVLEGGLFAMAMPRGSGKTALCAAACVWAAAYGHHEFILPIGATEEHGAEILSGIRVQFETNELLLADFPEVCHPIRRLEGIAQRRLLFNGSPIRMRMTGGALILPDIEHSRASGVIIGAAGLTGRLRGMKHTRPDGSEVRPSLVLVDDPQTDESAKSPSQVETRMGLLNGAVLGLSGPGRKISAMMPCTVIANGDLADRVLDRKANPQWQGERTKMVYAWPTNQKLWDEYAEIRARGLREDRGEKDGNAFYRTHRRAMDEGADLAWPERKDGCISAIQNAINRRLRSESAFRAEFQNDPIRPVDSGLKTLTAAQVASKINNLDRYTLAPTCTQITSFIDVHLDALYWMTAAWVPGFTGYIVDYGCFPDQGQQYFTLSSVSHTLAQRYPGKGPEGCIYAGLDELSQILIGVEYPRGDGTVSRANRLNVDANWGPMTDVVYQFCRQSKHSAQISPSHGKGIGSGAHPMSAWQQKPGEQHGLNWVFSPGSGRAIKHVTFDTNFWKSFIHSRLSTAMGDKGCLSLWGNSPEQHRMAADHITAEKPVRTSGRGRTVDEWKTPPNRDNHLFDCLIGCAVAASMQGISIDENAQPKAKRTFKIPPRG